MTRSNIVRLRDHPQPATRQRFLDYDPDIQGLIELIHDSGLTTGQIVARIVQASNGAWMPHYRTVENLLNGTTRRPQNFTISWIGKALGWERTWRPASRGSRRSKP